MKLAIFTVFAFLLFVSFSYARKDPETYWKSMMKDQPMPEAIKGLVNQDSTSTKENYDSTSKPRKVAKFNKDFDTRPIAIIYHKHDQSRAEGKDVNASKDNDKLRPVDSHN